MDDATLIKLRGDVINRTINIETIMSSIIAQHYFGRVVKSFLVEVLYDQGFSWRLKCSILRKIIENPDKQKLNDLDRLGGIRNRFAHYGIQMSEDLTTVPTEASFEILDHRKGELGVDFEKLYRDFESLASGVEPYLARVYRDIGGEIYTADEMTILDHQKKEATNHTPEGNVNMSMSDEQKNKIYEHLKNAGVHSICSACNQEVTWKQANTVTMLGITENTTPDLSRGILLIPIICENCGYVRLFSAKSVGLFEDS